MVKSQQNVFWHALIVTVVIFTAGIFLGILMENFRTSKIISLHQESEVDLLDMKLQNELISSEKIDCKTVKEYLIDFADDVYEEAQILGRYEEAGKLTEDMKLQHKKYDILRASLFLNSLKIKEKCNLSFDTLVYFYEYNEPGFDKKVMQNTYSKLLLELKKEKGEDIILIPIAGDNDLISVDMILRNYEINEKELPVILINEEYKVSSINNIDEIEQYLD